MEITFDREQRREQKTILKSIYADYDAKKHDVFVIKYNKDADKHNTIEYMNNRGIN